MSTDNELPDPFDPSTLFVAHPLERGGALPPLNAPAGSSGFTAAVSDQPTLKLTWHIRDDERVRCQLPPDGLWNAPTPCGATLAGFAVEDRAAAEAEHFRTCRHGCRAEILGE